MKRKQRKNVIRSLLSYQKGSTTGADGGDGGANLISI